MKPADAVGAIRLTAQDNVATVLRAIAPGERVVVRSGTQTATIVAAEAVPLCHKISLAAIGTGAAVVKYGQPIGLALTPIESGRHVHVHNMRSARGRSEQ